MQTEQLLCWSGMTDTEHSKTSSSNEEEVTNVQKFAMGAFRSQSPLTFYFGDLKLRDLVKLWFFKLIMTKSNIKKSVMKSFQ